MSEPSANTLSLETFLDGLAERDLRLPAEAAAYIALCIAESLADGLHRVSLASVSLDANGSLHVTGETCSELEACSAVTGVLAKLLVAARTATPQRLIGLLESPPASLDGLRDGLEAALVPLNRDASTRLLSRMLRDARRAKTENLPLAEDLDGAVDALTGVASEAPVTNDTLADSLSVMDERSARPRRPWLVLALFVLAVSAALTWWQLGAR